MDIILEDSDDCDCNFIEQISKDDQRLLLQIGFIYGIIFGVLYTALLSLTLESGKEANNEGECENYVIQAGDICLVYNILLVIFECALNPIFFFIFYKRDNKAKIKDLLVAILLFCRIGIQIFGMYAIYKCFTSFSNHTLSDCKALGNVIKCYVIEWICIIGIGALVLIVIFILIIKNKWKY